MTYVVIVPHYYGSGADLAEAKSNLRKAGGRVGSKARMILQFPPGLKFTGVDDMGYYHWKAEPGSEDAKPVVLEKRGL